jgi:hypothetical protein
MPVNATKPPPPSTKTTATMVHVLDAEPVGGSSHSATDVLVGDVPPGTVVEGGGMHGSVVVVAAGTVVVVPEPVV